jgi:hypothetical protein
LEAVSGQREAWQAGEGDRDQQAEESAVVTTPRVPASLPPSLPPSLARSLEPSLPQSSPRSLARSLVRSTLSPNPPFAHRCLAASLPRCLAASLPRTHLQKAQVLGQAEPPAVRSGPPPPLVARLHVPGAHTCAHARTHAHARASTHSHTCARTREHAHARTRTRTHARTHTNARTRARTNSLSFSAVTVRPSHSRPYVSLAHLLACSHRLMHSLTRTHSLTHMHSRLVHATDT